MRMQTFSTQMDAPSGPALSIMSMFNMQFCIWSEADWDEPHECRDICAGVDNSTPGQKFGCCFKITSSGESEDGNRCTVRIGLWLASAGDKVSVNNAAMDGFCVDDCNEQVVKRGTPALFRFPKVKNHGDMLLPNLVLMIEWCPIESTFRIVPQVNGALAQCYIQQTNTDVFTSSQVEMALKKRPGCFPVPPKPLQRGKTPSEAMDEHIEKAKEKKRKRMQEEWGASSGDDGGVVTL